MKTLKINALFAFVVAISMMSCDKEESSNQDQLSVENEVVEFENRLPKQAAEEGDPGDSVSDCSFDGLIEATVRIGHFVGVNEFPNQFGADTQVEWKINGAVVNPRRPRFVRVNDHVSQAGPVEVCYSATSTDCQTINECVTIDFKG